MEPLIIVPQATSSVPRDNTTDPEAVKSSEDRATWGKGIEFLMSCIAMSVGLGNVWRFPFTALDNGGGAFLIPYLIVLFLIGKPIYYLEMVIGQFSSRGSVKVFDLCPAMKGKRFQVSFSNVEVAMPLRLKNMVKNINFMQNKNRYFFLKKINLRTIQICILMYCLINFAKVLQMFL